MKTIALAACLSVVLCGAARAADLPPVPAPYVAPPLAVPMWQGFYVGGMAGYAADTTSGTLARIEGPIVGGTFGAQGQWGSIVAGIEADAAWSNIGASATVLGVTATDRVIDTGTVRGRIGVAFDRVLLYGTGGFAWMQNQISLSVAIPPLVLASLSDSQFHTGWTLGAGAEVMFAPRWSVKAEYLYRSFGSANYFGALVSGGFPTGTLNQHSAQVGVNFHF